MREVKKNCDQSNSIFFFRMEFKHILFVFLLKCKIALAFVFVVVVVSMLLRKCFVY